MQQIQVKSEGLLLDYLFKALPDTKKTKIRQWLKYKAIAVNGMATSQFNFPLKPGDKITIEKNPHAADSKSVLFGVEIVYEDETIIVINKPAGLLTIATDKVHDKTAFSAVNDYLNRQDTQKQKRFGKVVRKKQIFLVHRLDRDTSGLLAFAKTATAKILLQEQWSQRFVQKKYFALVEGRPKNDAGTVSSYLIENKILRVYSGPRTPEAKLAITHYKVLRNNPEYSLLEIDLETGRKHQIRVHMSDIRCPIAGDKDYGAQTNPAGRLCLHACELSFAHPVTHKKMRFTLEMPQSFERVIAA